MPAIENRPAPGKRKEQAPVPAVPEKTRRIIRAGVGFALVCAAAMSAPTLFNLAELVGFKRNLAWLLPACLDGYAGTSILFGSKVPAGHPARKAATKNARLALALTVFANAIFHLLVLAGTMVPHWGSITLLVTVSSLPPFIVHRLLHLHALADGTGTETVPTATQAPTERRQAEAPTKAPTADRVPTVPTAPPMRVPIPAPTMAAVGTRTADTSADAGADDSADVIDMSSAGAAVRRKLPEWVELALPHYRHLAETFDPVTAPQLADRLADAGHGTLKPSRARDVCAATKKLAAELGDKAEPEADRELIGAAR